MDCPPVYLVCVRGGGMRSHAQRESEDPTLCSVVVVKWKDFLHVVKGVWGWKGEDEGSFFFTSNYNACLH